MPQEIYPTVKKTVKENIALFNFIERDNDGNLTQSETYQISVTKRTNKNSLQLKLAKQYPEKTVQILGFEEIKKVYTMSAEKFMELAECEVIQ